MKFVTFPAGGTSERGRGSLPAGDTQKREEPSRERLPVRDRRQCMVDPAPSRKEPAPQGPLSLLDQRWHGPGRPAKQSSAGTSEGPARRGAFEAPAQGRLAPEFGKCEPASILAWQRAARLPVKPGLARTRRKRPGGGGPAGKVPPALRKALPDGRAGLSEASDRGKPGPRIGQNRFVPILV